MDYIFHIQDPTPLLHRSSCASLAVNVVREVLATDVVIGSVGADRSDRPVQDRDQVGILFADDDAGAFAQQRRMAYFVAHQRERLAARTAEEAALQDRTAR